MQTSIAFILYQQKANIFNFLEMAAKFAWLRPVPYQSLLYPPNTYTMPWIRTDKIYTLIDHVLLLFITYFIYEYMKPVCTQYVM